MPDDDDIIAERALAKQQAIRNIQQRRYIAHAPHFNGATPAVADDDVQQQNGASPTSAKTAPATTPLFFPVAVARFADFIRDTKLHERFMPGRILMNFTFSINQDAENANKVSLYQETAVLKCDEEEMSEDICDKRVKVRMLNAYVIAHDAQSMPVDTIFSLKSGERTAQVPPVTNYTNGGAVLLRNSTSNAADQPTTLFGNELVYEEPLTGTQFSSVEAINFNSVDLLNRVVVRVENGDTQHIARLFCISNRQRQLQRHFIPCTRHAVSDQCFALVPLMYSYRSLLVRVHMFLAVRQYAEDVNHAPLAMKAMLDDESLYTLPVTSDFVIFDCNSLTRVVEFIDRHLLNAHPLFSVVEVQAALRPFNPSVSPMGCYMNSATATYGHETPIADGVKRLQQAASLAHTSSSWLNVWNSRNAQREQLLVADDVDAAEQLNGSLTCHVTCLFYYITVQSDDQIDQPLLVRRPIRRPPPLLQSIGTTTTDDEKTIDDNGDDGEASTIVDNDSYTHLSNKSAPTRAVSLPMAATVKRAHHSEAPQYSTNNDNALTRAIPITTNFKKQAPSSTQRPSNNNSAAAAAAADDNSSYDFSFSKYIKPSLSANTPTDNGTPATAKYSSDNGSQKTPRTEPYSEQPHSNLATASAQNISATTDSQEGVSDDDSEDSSDASSLFDAAPLPLPPASSAASTALSTATTKVPYNNNNVYHTIPQHMRVPPQSPQTHTQSSNNESSGEQTIFHMSSSSTTNETITTTQLH